MVIFWGILGDEIGRGFSDVPKGRDVSVCV
jgi:hypothetical protein